VTIAPAIRGGLVRVSGIDPKGMDLAYGRRIFARYAWANRIIEVEPGVGYVFGEGTGALAHSDGLGFRRHDQAPRNLRRRPDYSPHGGSAFSDQAHRSGWVDPRWCRMSTTELCPRWCVDDS
jgi:hypothetical protein